MTADIRTWDRDRCRAELLQYAAGVAAGDYPEAFVKDEILPLTVPEWVGIHQARTAFTALVSAVRSGAPVGEWLGVLTGGVEA